MDDHLSDDAALLARAERAERKARRLGLRLAYYYLAAPANAVHPGSERAWKRWQKRLQRIHRLVEAEYSRKR